MKKQLIALFAPLHEFLWRLMNLARLLNVPLEDLWLMPHYARFFLRLFFQINLATPPFSLRNGQLVLSRVKNGNMPSPSAVSFSGTPRLTV